MTRRNGYASFSECTKFRYELGGDLGDQLFGPRANAASETRPILWIMLNPSTADASHDDPTIRTCGVFSEMWGYNRILIGNVYAYRSTDPKAMLKLMKAGVDVEGPDNNRVLTEMVGRVRTQNGIVMAAWGTHAHRERVKVVQQIAGRMMCLKTNKDGSPVHPLYQPHKLVPITWEGMP